MEDYFLTTNAGISRDLFIPYKKARTLTYTTHITEAFKKCGIVPFKPRVVPGQPTAASRAQARHHTEGFPLENTPYTKFQLR